MNWYQSFGFLADFPSNCIQSLVDLIEMLRIFSIDKTHQLAEIFIVLHREVPALVPQVDQNSNHTLEYSLHLFLVVEVHLTIVAEIDSIFCW